MWARASRGRRLFTMAATACASWGRSCRRADGRRLHHLKRFELPHANPGVVEPPGHANENAPYRRSPRPAMSTPTSAAAAKDFKVQAGLVTRDLRHRTLIQTAL